jgi:hypothetical protein
MMPLTRFDTIFCRPKPTPTPTAPEKIASAVDPDRAQHDQHRKSDQRGAGELAEQHLDRWREVTVGAQPRIQEIAQRHGAPERDQEQCGGLEHQQRRDAQAADADRGAVEPRDGLVEQPDDAAGANRPPAPIPAAPRRRSTRAESVSRPT